MTLAVAEGEKLAKCGLYRALKARYAGKSLVGTACTETCRVQDCKAETATITVTGVVDLAATDETKADRCPLLNVEHGASVETARSAITETL